MRGFALLALAGLALAGWSGCMSDCKESADIQVTIIAGPGVDVSRVAKLRITLVVNDDAPKSTDYVPKAPLKADATGSTLLLHPDPAPSARYQVSVTINALDGEGNLLAIGSDGGPVASSGCNRLTMHLAGLPGGMPSSDMAGGMTGPDLAACFGALPDEDSDARANSCDICAADPEPPTAPDGDGDGVPDACDPDPTAAGNKVIYFEPFDAEPGTWSETTSGAFVTQGYLVLDSGPAGTLSSRNTTATIPNNVSVETWVYIIPLQQGSEVSTGIFIGPQPAPANPNGVLCSTTFNPVQGTADTVEIVPVVNGTIQASSAQVANLTVAFPFQTLLRLRLTQRGNSYICELGVPNQANNGVDTLAVTPPLSVNTATGNQFMILRAENQQAHFHSVFAETTMP
jgi:hypothetical protein